MWSDVLVDGKVCPCWLCCPARNVLMFVMTVVLSSISMARGVVDIRSNLTPSSIILRQKLTCQSHFQVIGNNFSQSSNSGLGRLFRSYILQKNSHPCTLGFRVGCPRNNQIFFSVWTETNRNSICFSCFSVCFAKSKNIFFGLFRCFGQVSKQPKQTELGENKPEQTETNRKNRQKTFPIRVSSKQLIFFSRFEPKQTETQSV